MRGPDGVVVGIDETSRCWWCGGDEEYTRYHDDEWGFPVTDDVRLFEKICLEGFQAGLSWILILRRRENFRKAFAGFDYEKVARFDRRRVDRLVRDAGIIRHRGKVESTINNAKRAREMADEFGSLAAYFWSFEPEAKERPKRLTRKYLAENPHTATSAALSKDLRRRGWTFVGPTTAYAFMQAMGLVNDHLPACHAHPKAERARTRLRRPS